MTSKCIIVNRVSSAEQKEGYSLDAQSRHGQAYALKQELQILKEFTFQESASKQSEQRRFDEVLAFITAQCSRGKEPLHVIVEKKDRWGRLHSRKEFIQTLVLEGKVVVHYYREGQIFDKNCSPEDIFMDDVVTSMNKYTALNIGRESRKGMREKARQGWLPHKPPPGYRNNPDRASPLPIIVNESEREWVVKMFELRGNEGLSYEAVALSLIQRGLVPENRKRSFSRSHVEKILKNPFYSGKIVWNGEEYSGRHEIIISPSLLQRVIGSFEKIGTRFDTGIEALFGGFFRCGTSDCGCNVTFDLKRKPSGRTYHFYHCTNGRRVHASLKGLYMSENEIFDKLTPAIERIAITDDMAEAVSKALNVNHIALQTKLKREVTIYQTGIRETERREDEAYRDMKRDLLSEDMFLRLRDQLRGERDRLTALIFDLQSSVTETYLQTAKSILELAKEAKNLWLSRSREERAAFLRKILSNPRITGRTIEYELRKPFAVVEKMTAGGEWGG